MLRAPRRPVLTQPRTSSRPSRPRAASPGTRGRGLSPPWWPDAPSVFSVSFINPRRAGVGTLFRVLSELTISPDGLGGYRIQNRDTYGVELSVLASVVLGGASIPRAIRLRKPVPIMLSVVSTFGMAVFGSTLFKRA